MSQRRTRMTIAGVVFTLTVSGCVRFTDELSGSAGTLAVDQALAVDIGDVDGDGVGEAVVLTSREIVTMSICGADCLERESAIVLDAVDDPADTVHATTFAVGDYNNDGVDDVAVGTALTVRVYFGGIEGSNRPTAGLRADDVSAPIEGRPESEQYTGDVPGNPWRVMGPADINDDAVDDLVLTYSDAYAYSASAGPTSFDSTTDVLFDLVDAQGIYGDALADVDGDDHNELLVHRFGVAGGIVFTDVRVLGSPGFSTLVQGDAFCGLLVVGDTDGDGFDDVVLGNNVHLSTGTAFSQTVSGVVEEGSGLISDIDLDGDGDLLSADVGDNSIGWRTGDGSGGFYDGPLGLIERPVDAVPGQFVVGDVTGDGFDDVVMIDEGAESARVVLLVNDSENPDGEYVEPHEQPRRSISNRVPFICTFPN